MPEHLNRNGRNTSTNTENRISSTFKVGAIALVFLILGYQICLFIQRAAVMRVEANRDRPDTVYVYLTPPEAGATKTRTAQSEAGATKTRAAQSEAGAPAPGAAPAVAKVERKDAQHSPAVQKMRESRRKVESFRFNPNEATLEEFIRLGFSEKQAQSLINYRLKGGRFHRASDFAKSYVVADSVFERLEPFIDIPKLDINSADSAAFDALPGIGPWFAAKMVEYRGSLGGYGSTRQLMDIYRFDEERYAGIEDLIYCGNPATLPLWTMDEQALGSHPAIRSSRTARSIALWRSTMPREKWTLEELLAAGVVDEGQYTRLSRCLIVPAGADDAPE